ncbi:MAG TPA: polysaccharide deacetylase family protein [Candidatus Limnocylindrales bacterium]|nr:polysaccharide deacetylase family protein [Candidatus Limnocylindrales bacterium]
MRAFLKPVAACLALALMLAACVPDTARPGRSPDGSIGPPTPTPAPTGPTPVPSFVAPTPTPVPSFRAYEVVPGDTLLSIARTFDTTGRSIAYWNRGTYPNLDPESDAYAPNLIRAGWVLLIIPGAVVDPQTLPDQTPRPATPDPNATLIPAEPVVTPAPGDGAIVFSHGSREARGVALTFDMGDRVDGAREVFDWLTDSSVPATIFAAGQTATTTPRGRAVLQRAAARPDLFDVGNLTWDAPLLTDLDAAAIGDQLVRTEAAISTFAGVTTKPWFRPPDGVWDDDVRLAVGDAGWAYLMLWDVDTRDAVATADGGPTALDIEATVLSRVQGGSIVRLHLGGWNTREALPGIVEGLEEKGLVPVTLSELLVP